MKTGVGYPQLSAVIECADAAHGLGGQIVSDGGCSVPGDVAKAFGSGADFVLLGGMLAGHDECEAPWWKENGEKFMLFYGMSSESAMAATSAVWRIARPKAKPSSCRCVARWSYRARYPRRPAFRLHLRWCRAPEKS